MGGKGTSAGTKSSKKKRNKVSSKLLKKKTRRKESKVLHNPGSDSVSLSSKSTSSTSSESKTQKNKSKKRSRDDLASSYSDDYSMTSSSDSLSVHDDKIYKRRKALPQGRKKRPRKIFESADSDAESRRRKRSRRHHVVKSRNKPLKKKSRRHLISSSSSDSESCSTCDSRSKNSTGDGKRRRSKLILDKKIKSSRGRESHRARRKRKTRSPSCSSCSTSRDRDVGVDLSDKALDHEIRVDRSCEALVPVHNSRRLKSVIAIVYRPTDEEENRREKDPQKEEIVCDHDDYPSPKSMDSSEGVNNKESEDQSHGASNKRIRVENVKSGVILLMKSENNGNEGYNADDCLSHEVHTNSSENEKEIHVSVNFTLLDGDKKKDGVGDDLELILRQKALENLRKFKGGLQAAQKSINLDTKNENVNEPPIKRNDNIQNEPNSFLAQETDRRSRPMLPEVEKDSDAEHTATDPPAAPVILAVNDTYQATGEHSSKEPRDEAKNVSEFEQKTMSVMRGGETVQVSYKVYIPKQAPALARRQLRR